LFILYVLTYDLRLEFPGKIIYIESTQWCEIVHINYHFFPF
jgi:hypothetical protein